MTFFWFFGTCSRGKECYSDVRSKVPVCIHFIVSDNQVSGNAS